MTANDVGRVIFTRRFNKVDLTEWTFPKLDGRMPQRDRKTCVKEIGALINEAFREDTHCRFELSKRGLLMIVGVPLNGADAFYGELKLSPALVDDLTNDHFPDLDDLRKIAKAFRALADRADATVMQAEEHHVKETQGASSPPRRSA